MLIFNLSPLDLSPSCLQVCPILQQGMNRYALNVPGNRKVHTIQESVLFLQHARVADFGNKIWLNNVYLPLFCHLCHPSVTDLSICSAIYYIRKGAGNSNVSKNYRKG